ncbi:hypothetical protein B0H14DRAFT_1015388 [Mycena olivaceomarginata]|nr:hypothetical protein B0H14DRAFT_1015388 [Mycena olivaceomarginata]
MADAMWKAHPGSRRTKRMGGRGVPRELRPRRPHPLLRESSRRPSRPRPRVRVRVRTRGVIRRRVTSGSGSCVVRIGLGGNALVLRLADGVGVKPGIGRQSGGKWTQRAPRTASCGEQARAVTPLKIIAAPAGSTRATRARRNEAPAACCISRARGECMGVVRGRGEVVSAARVKQAGSGFVALRSASCCYKRPTRAAGSAGSRCACRIRRSREAGRSDGRTEGSARPEWRGTTLLYTL